MAQRFINGPVTLHILEGLCRMGSPDVFPHDLYRSEAARSRQNVRPLVCLSRGDNVEYWGVSIWSGDLEKQQKAVWSSQFRTAEEVGGIRLR